MGAAAADEGGKNDVTVVVSGTVILGASSRGHPSLPWRPPWATRSDADSAASPGEFVRALLSHHRIGGRRVDSTIVRCFAALIALALADSAIAVQRTFVASFGLSANTAFNCSLAKPCRAFSEALGVTSVDGEVVVLDSAGYGPVTITQGVSIIAPAGIYAGVTVSAGDGITINAPGAVVRLRGLSINGQGGNDGIVFRTVPVSASRIAR